MPSTPSVGSDSSASTGAGENAPGRRKRLTASFRNLLRRSSSPSSSERLVVGANPVPGVVVGDPLGLTGVANPRSNDVQAAMASPVTMVIPVSVAIPATATESDQTPIRNDPAAGIPLPGIKPTVPPVTGQATSGSTLGRGITKNPVKITLTKPTGGSESNPHLPWEMALAKLSPEDQQIINLSDFDKLGALDKVLEETQKNRDICRQRQWKYSWKGETVVLRDIADNMVTWIDNFKSIGDVVGSFDPAHAALPWAGFRFLLQIVVDDNLKMGALLVALEGIANLMGRCAIYETLYLGGETASSVKFEEVVVELYVSILLYLVRAKQYYLTNTGVRIAFGVFNTKLISLLDDVHIKEAAVLRVTALAEVEYQRLADAKIGDQITKNSKELKGLLERFTVPIMQMQSDIEVLRDGLLDAERTEILKWMSRVEYAKHHLNAKEGCVEGTGEWLLQKQEFLEWQNSSTSSILWLRGIPGSGKTKLTSRVIDTILRQQENSNNTEAVAYFYCKRDETGSTDPEVMMSTLVKQLSCLGGGSALRKEVIDVYEARKKSGFSSISLAFNESLRLIHLLVETYQQTTIVVDALDECDPLKRKGFLDSVKIIVNSPSTGRIVKVFISSRNDNDIVLRLDEVPNLWIEAKDNQEDIRRFVQEEVTRCIEDQELLYGNVTNELKQKIITSLTNGSQGMYMPPREDLSPFQVPSSLPTCSPVISTEGRFLWVDLQIKEICSLDVATDVESMLGKLPETLEITYTEIYKRITSQRGSSSQLAKKALMWVMCSYQPFPPEQLVTAISLGSTTGSGLVAASLFKLCHNLLTLDRQQNIVRFAHLSVREFLEKRHFSNSNAHRMVAETCLSFLMNPVNLEPIHALDPHSCPIAEIRNVTVYPVIHWPMHIQESQLDDQKDGLEQPTAKLLGEFLRTSTTEWYKTYDIIKIARERFGVRPPTDEFRELDFTPLLPLQVACIFGFGNIIKSLWDSESWDVNAISERGLTALAIASQRGDLWIVKTLLENEADVNAAGGALAAAISRKDNEQVLQLLLENGADTNANVGYYGNPLQAAVAQTGREEIVKLLLENGADINAKGGIHGNALVAATCRSGDENIIQLLLENGADVNGEGGMYGNALQATIAQGGQEGTVKLLLENGADINAKGGHYGNALLAAVSQRGNEKIVQLLLENGANVNAEHSRLGSALLEAVGRRGNEKVVQLLLENGANANAQGGYYGNALLAAERLTGNEKVVQLLLEHGADRRALQAESNRNRNEMRIKLLSKNEAYLNENGSNYLKALREAALREAANLSEKDRSV